MKILFVCEGNIIRSPLAANLFRHLAVERGFGERYEVDSAGTSAYHVGEQPDHRMREVAGGKGFHYSGRARQFRQDEFSQFDLIVAMDQRNLARLESWAANRDDLGKIRLLREFDPEKVQGLDVPDPYYGGIDGFEVTYRIVERSVQGLLEALESGRRPS